MAEFTFSQSNRINLPKHSDEEYVTDYKKYTNKNPLIRLILKKYFKDLINLIKRNNIRTILDAGCGDGFIIEQLRKINNLEIVGLDICENALKIAKSINPSANFQQGSIYNLPFKDDSFNCVLNLNVLEHLDNPNLAISEVKRITKEYCIIGVPNDPLFRFANLLRFKHIKTFGNPKAHINGWSKKGFKNLLNAYFNQVKVVKSSIWLIALCKD